MFFPLPPSIRDDFPEEREWKSRIDTLGEGWKKGKQTKFDILTKLLACASRFPFPPSIFHAVQEEQEEEEGKKWQF